MTHAVDVRRRERVAEEREDVTLELLEALKVAVPAGVATDNRNIPDSQIIPLDFTMGELRRIAAAIAKAEALNREGKR
jgi:hypothetical protein